jgi:hypothetical protein
MKNIKTISALLTIALVIITSSFTRKKSSNNEYGFISAQWIIPGILKQYTLIDLTQLDAAEVEYNCTQSYSAHCKAILSGSLLGNNIIVSGIYNEIITICVCPYENNIGLIYANSRFEY